MLTKIEIAKVNSFIAPAALETDKKINLVYGLNGAGKSTMSSFLQNPSDTKFANCKLTPSAADPILVYNQTFVQENFYVADRLRGIFSLSKENKAAEQKIGSANKNLAQLLEQQEKKHQELTTCDRLFSSQRQKAVDEVWKIKTNYSGGDRVLEYCLEGLKGNKDRLFDHLHSLPERPDAAKAIELIRREVSELSGDAAQPQNYVTLVTLDASSVESSSIFSRPIVGNNDAEFGILIEKLGNFSWVEEGQSYISTTGADEPQNCPFCQEKTITRELIEKIKSYFDEDYKLEMASLHRLRDAYAEEFEQVPALTVYITHQFGTGRTTELTTKFHLLLDLLHRNLQAIAAKIKAPKSVLQLESSTDALNELNYEIRAINADVENYNERLRNKQASLDALKSEFWGAMQYEYHQTLSRYEQDVQEARVARTAIQNDIEFIEKSIASERAALAIAQKETVNIDAAIEAINLGLAEIGIDGFRINKYSESLYRVVRTDDGESAFNSLSEGEKMMISFLYFCELCKGKASASDTTGKRIAVIDDPVSSLSHIFVFNVGQLIRSTFFQSERISQVFVLTHSLYFFYELTDNNHERRKENQKLYRISKTKTGSTIEEMKYEEIQNDYQAYWSVINDPGHPPALIANCMRNVVEYFFNFVRKKDLNNVFAMPELQQQKFLAFNRYINRESHSLGQNILDMKEFDYQVFRTALEMLFHKAGYGDHYKAMARL